MGAYHMDLYHYDVIDDVMGHRPFTIRCLLLPHYIIMVQGLREFMSYAWKSLGMMLTKMSFDSRD